MVGALARTLSPQTDRTKEQIKNGNGRFAEIQCINGVNGQHNGNGRNRNRIRRQYRKSHQETLKEFDDLCIGTWNTQGADWARTEERHISKFLCLMQVMRDTKVDIMCLTELHGRLDERVGVDTRFMTCMVEQFLLVQCDRAVFFMTPAVYKCWNGSARCWDNDGLVATIDLVIGSCQVRIGSVYMPPLGSSIGLREKVFEWVEKANVGTGNGKCVIFGGDWNSHIGRDGVEGGQAMLSPSSYGGKQMLDWLRSRKIKGKLNVVDQRLVLRKRGTWRHSSGSNWYELDYFIADVKYIGRFSKLQAFAVGESDHAAKLVRYRMAGVPKAGE